MRNIERFVAVLGKCHFQNYAFEVTSEGGNYFVCGVFAAPCNKSGAWALQRTRKWRLSPHMTKSEIVQTAFKLVLTSIEHEAREQFTYDGAAIFGPHFDVDILADMVKRGSCEDERVEHQHNNEVTA